MRLIEDIERIEALSREDAVSLCCMRVDKALFGIDTRKICEVLANVSTQRVPLAPEFIGGAIAYRGEVLTAVSLRALLGAAEWPGENCVLVLDDEVYGERFGLLVDRVDGVVIVDGRSREANPSSLDARSRELFDGVYALDFGLLVRLNPERLRPSRLAESGLFGGHPVRANRGRLAHENRTLDAWREAR